VTREGERGVIEERERLRPVQPQIINVLLGTELMYLAIHVNRVISPETLRQAPAAERGITPTPVCTIEVLEETFGILDPLFPLRISFLGV